MRVFIGGYRGVSLFSVGVRLGTWSLYSHTALIRDDGVSIESWHKGGVQKCNTPFTIHSDGTVVDLFELQYPKDLHSIVWASAEGMVGCGYDFRALLGFVPGLRWAWKDVSNKWFCSHQTAENCLIDERYRLFNKTLPTYKISPGYLLSSPWLRKLGSMKNMADFYTLI